MATIEILGWKKGFVGFTAWDDHARSELRRRLRRGLKSSQAEIKRVARRIDAREHVSLQNIRNEALHGLTQILQTTGADLRVSIEGSSSRQLFRKCPKRSC